MQKFFLSLVALSLVTILGCTEIITVDANPQSEDQISSLYDSERLGPPAYALAHERFKSGKADANDDIRAKNPELYAITEAPKLDNWRHMTEWEPMTAMVFTLSDYVGSNKKYQDMYAAMTKGATEVAEVWAIYNTNFVKSKMEPAMADAGADMAKVKFIQMVNETVWFIDYGPLPLIDVTTNTQSFLDWNYYHGRPLDDAISTKLGELMGGNTYRMQFGFEGGNFQGDGKNNCYTTQRALYWSGWTAEKMASGLKDYANCQNLHVVKDITNDGTGHIDMFFKLFADDQSIIGEYPDGVDDKNQKNMNDNVAQLEAIAIADGNNMKVHRIVMPGLGLDGNGKVTTTPFTFINSTLINGNNLYPDFSFESWADKRALAKQQWMDAMPDWNHIGIIADDISLASGAIHCITRTIPDMPFAKWIPNGTCTDSLCVPPAEFTDLGHVGDCKDDTTCFGPKWLCNCNNCDKECPEPGDTPPAECGDITFEGCCNGDTLQYCEGGQLKGGACEAGTCGWSNGNNYYDCSTEGGEDPSGTFPKECSGSTTGSTTGGPTSDCTDKDCGPDGAGGSCGICGDSEQCEAGTCVSTVTCEDACAVGGAGCLDENTPWGCQFDPDSGCKVQAPKDACHDGETCFEGVCGTEHTSGDGTTGTDGGDGTTGTDGGDGTTGTDGGTSGTDGGGTDSANTGGKSSGGCITANTPNNAPATGILLLLVLAMAAILRTRVNE